MSDTISIIVLNWCNWSDTLTCLDSLLALNSPLPIKLIVCDNASPNDSFQQLQHWAQQHFSAQDCAIYSQAPAPQAAHTVPAFTLIQTGQNLGFAGGNNIGLLYALTDPECRYLWVLNNDTIATPDALAQLVLSAEQQPEVGLWGSTLVESHAPQQVQCAGGCRYYPLLTIFRPVLGGQTLEQVLQQNPAQVHLDYVAGASLFFRAAAMRRVGLLNEIYFLFYEELDYCQRLKHAGYQLGWCRDSVVYHQGSASVGSVREGDKEKLKRANYYENLSTLKYSANFHARWLMLIALARFSLKSAALVVSGRWFLFPPLFAAYRDFWHWWR